MVKDHRIDPRFHRNLSGRATMQLHPAPISVIKKPKARVVGVGGRVKTRSSLLALSTRELSLHGYQSYDVISFCNVPRKTATPKIDKHDSHVDGYIRYI